MALEIPLLLCEKGAHKSLSGVLHHLGSVYGDTPACWNNKNPLADCLHGWWAFVGLRQDPNSQSFDSLDKKH